MTQHYQGGELDLFAAATCWKRYVGETLAPHIAGRVAEIGAGIGGNIRFLLNDRVTHWLAVEPDPALAARLGPGVDPRCSARCGSLADLDPGSRFDTILYIDVLEHIADDRGEFAHAAALLAPGGRLIVLAPAHGWLFSAFDAAIGHHRRYNRRSLLARTASTLPGETFYLDSVGLLASLANRLLLRQSLPTPRQIAFWDGVLVPLSRRLDPLLGRRAGKTVVGIWTAPA